MARPLTAQLGLAARAALVIGAVFGLYEGLHAVDRNAVAFVAQYAWLYAVVPIQLWVLLALALAALCALVIAAVDPRAAEGRGLWRYSAVLGGAGAVSIVLPLALETMTRLQQVGVGGGSIALLVGVLAVAVVVVVAMLFGAAAAWYEPRVATPLRLAAASCLLLCLVGLIPVATFFANEERWSPDSARPLPPSAAAAHPNLLIVSLDTLRADALGSYGGAGDLTPNLDRLAGEGVRFEHAITSSSWTLPAMASLFTGLNVRRHGAGWVTNPRDPLGRAPLAPELWTLTRALRQRGYETAAIITNPYLALRYGFGRGFDTYENLSIRSEIVVAFQDTALVRLMTWAWPGMVPGDRAGVVTARAVAWLRHRPAERPFFLWLHYIDPHAPYSPGNETRINSFRGDSLLGEAGARGLQGGVPDIARLRSGEVRPDAEQKRELRQRYDGEVAELDASLGVLLAALDSLGLTSSTLVVVVADHGEEFWEHGGVEHGRTVYDEVVRIPLLLRWPGVLDGGTIVSSLIGIVDVAPTIMELFEWPAPDAIDGSGAALRRQARSPEAVLIESMHFAEERVGLRTATHKYVRWDNGKEEVYDLRADPGERIDLAGVDGVAAPLRRMLDGFEASPPSAAAAAVHPGGATREALRALGYVD